MSLAQALNNLEGDFEARRCTVAQILERLDDTDRDALLKAIANPLIKHTTLAAELRRHGHDIQGVTLGRHRRELCRCPR